MGAIDFVMFKAEKGPKPKKGLNPEWKTPLPKRKNLKRNRKKQNKIRVSGPVGPPPAPAAPKKPSGKVSPAPKRNPMSMGLLDDIKKGKILTTPKELPEKVLTGREALMGMLNQNGKAPQKNKTLFKCGECEELFTGIKKIEHTKCGRRKNFQMTWTKIKKNGDEIIKDQKEDGETAARASLRKFRKLVAGDSKVSSDDSWNSDSDRRRMASRTPTGDKARRLIDRFIRESVRCQNS